MSTAAIQATLLDARRSIDLALAQLDAVVTPPPPPLQPPPRDGWVQDAIRAATTKRYDAAHRPERVKPVEFVVLHYTASPPGDGPQGSDLGRIQRWAADASRSSSTHFVVLRDGRVVQLVSLEARAWHVTSQWSWPGDGRGNINDRSIGVDFENVGWLQERDSAFYNGYGGLHAGEVGHDRRGRPWEPYTDAQIESAKALLGMLGEAFPTLRDGAPHRLIRHTEAQPSRPDPGPLCPFDKLYAAMEGR